MIQKIMNLALTPKPNLSVSQPTDHVAHTHKTNLPHLHFCKEKTVDLRHDEIASAVRHLLPDIRQG
jgi:hypothetical protein